jgi:hypothetical protein
MAVVNAVPKAKVRPTMMDIQEQLMALHECVHASAQDVRHVRHDLKNHRMEVTQQFGDVRERVAKIEGRQEAANERLGVKPDAAKQKPAWFPNPWQIVTGIGALGLAYRFAVPVIEAAHHALMTVK